MSYSDKQSNKKGNQLTLTMKRKMARVVVEIAGFNDQYAGAKIDNVNSLSICGIKAYKHSDGKFYALIKPCAESSETFISLDVAEGESKTTTEKLTGIPALTAGNSYTYQLKVGKNKISVSGITVANWNTGEIPGGKAETDNTPYITFTAEGEQIFKMITESSSNGPYGENEPYKISGLEYSVNNNDVWKKVVENEEVTFGGNNNGTLRLRGKNIAGTAKDGWNYATITFDKPGVKVTCTGDIRTLLDYESYKTVKTDQALFIKLFQNCKAITSAPDLPAETLADDCYSFMFEGCTSLKTAPKLPATTLAGNCYFRMFLGCTSLETAPELRATQLNSGCYGYMFAGCTSLKTAPELQTTDLFVGCYEGMFRGCNSLESAPELPATTLAIQCYAYMFQNCANLSSVTMLAPSDQIKKNSNCCLNWLSDAGTNDGITRTLIVLDEDANNMLVNKNYLPASWKKDATNTTVENYTPKP